MKDLLKYVHVVVKTLTLEIPRSCLADYVKNYAKKRAARAARFRFFNKPIRSLFSGVVFATD